METNNNLIECKNCKELISLEDGENESCEHCNKECCCNCIIHTEEDVYTCEKCF